VSEPGSRLWTLTLAALTATTALSIDMSLPAQPTLIREFSVGEDVAQLTLGVFLAGFAVGQLLAGVLSDTCGRRRVLIAGLVVFTLGGVASALSPSMPLLLAARTLQGFGAAAGPVIARAMVRDTQPVDRAARILAAMVTALAVAPMLAPIAGGFLLELWSWHAIFAALAVVGGLFVAVSCGSLGETLPVHRRQPLSARAVIARVGVFFSTPETRAPTAVLCVSFGGQFAFIADSPFVLIDRFEVAASMYGFYFAVTAAALMAGAAMGARLLKRTEPSRVVRIGTVLLATGGALTAALVHFESLGPLGLVAPMLVYYFGAGLTSPSSMALAMAPLPELAGTSSAVIGGLQMLSGALAGWVVTRLGGDDPRVLGIVVAALGAIACATAFTGLTRPTGRASA
jgi:DHA1 family bicyclomycin/chloramphenicol resistance-like MFS transporter